MILSRETLNKISTIDSTRTEDPFVLISAVGLDPRTFFDYGDWNGLDFSPYDMRSINFFRAFVTNCIFNEGDISERTASSCRVFANNRFVDKRTIPAEQLTLFDVLPFEEHTAQWKLHSTAPSLTWRVLDDFQKEELQNVDLSGADLSGEDLGGVNLRGAKLVGAELFGTNLTDGILVEADLQGTCVFGANLTRANLTRANLKGANLWAACLFAANLRYARLEGTNLLQADLWHACLIGADLTGADLTGTDLTKADFTEADLSGANLSDNSFIRKSWGLCNARHLDQALLPEGWKVKWKKRVKKWDITTPDGRYVDPRKRK